MDSFFIEPGSLPGGRVWNEVCETITRPEYINSTYAAGKRELVSEAMRCHLSPSSGLIQVLLLLCVYGGVLYTASQLIANGSELLLLVPSMKSIVGSVILPILGAVPDGAIVLFSGLGSNAQEELSVGVGALAGSTCMLLTVPWVLSIIAGRVNIRSDGVLTYHHRPHKLTPPEWDLTRTGVEPLHVVKKSGQVMLITSVSYIVIQLAAIRSGTFFAAQQTPEITAAAARAERLPAAFCFCVCFGFFAWYLYSQVKASDEQILNQEAYVDELKQKYVRNGQISLTAAFQDVWGAALEADEGTGLMVDVHKKERLVGFLRTFFNGYDLNNDHHISALELQFLMGDLGEKCTPDEIKYMYTTMDKDNDGRISREEFVECMPNFLISRARARQAQAMGKRQTGVESGLVERSFDDEDGDEVEEVPEDLRHKDPTVQINKVKRRSFLMMGIGTVLVLIFSDPMVGVLSDIGQRIGVPAFYISFIVAPLASNASELFAAYSYAAKKTRKTVTISFSTLLGAAIMNNTFVLSIFMLLITLKGLAWQFTAETITILLVEAIMFRMSQKDVMTLKDGWFIVSLFPLSIFVVFFLENVIGLD